MELKKRFEVLQSILEEAEDVKILNKKLANFLKEIAKKIVGKAQVKQTNKITAETKRFKRNSENLKRRKTIPNQEFPNPVKTRERTLMNIS